MNEKTLIDVQLFIIDFNLEKFQELIIKISYDYESNNLPLPPNYFDLMTRIIDFRKSIEKE